MALTPVGEYHEFCDTAEKQFLKHIPPVAEDRPDLEVQFIALRTAVIGFLAVRHLRCFPR